MNELLNIGQDISIVPHDFRNSNKGKIIKVENRTFLIEVIKEPVGLAPSLVMEFYAPTPNGTLYFNSSLTEINGKILTARVPLKHRFLQRRAFTRVKFSKEMELKLNNQTHVVKSMDLSFGGMKLNAKEALSVDDTYELVIPLIKGQDIKCVFQPIRTEKKDNETYTISGRFHELTDADKMVLTQFCMRKKIEDENK